MRETPHLDASAFLSKVESKRAVALATVDNALACQEAWLAAGFAVEFALKALILRRSGLEAWPDRLERPDLYTHDLRRLFVVAGIDLKAAPLPVRPALRTVMDWNRAHEYSAGRMSRRVARNMVSAAFDDEGVVAWLTTL